MALLSKIDVRNFNTKRSGQSAIEYLMTYGWMLLVVAIAGGAIFSIAGDQSVESITGFSGDVEVDDFGVSENGLDLVLRNMDSNTVDVNEVTVSDDEIQASADGTSISVGSTEVVTVSNAQPGTETAELDVNINYDVGGLTGLETSGVIVAEIEISGVGFTVSDTNPEPEQEVDFEDTSNIDDLDGDFVERRWDFNGNGTAEEISGTESDTVTTHNYSSEGTYDAELELETTAENYTATRTITVSEEEEEEETETADVTTSGGELNTLQTSTDDDQTIRLTGNSEPCLGNYCSDVEGDEEDETVVTTAGAEMSGTLTASEITGGNLTITSLDEDLTFEDSGEEEDLTDETVLMGDLEMPTLITGEINLVE